MQLMSLRSKIYSGFALIVVLLVFNGVLSYVGLGRLRSTTDALQHVEGVNATVLTIARDVQELRLRVDRYVASGHDSLRDEVGKINRRLDRHIQHVYSQPIDDRMRELFAAIQHRMQAYAEQFDTVVEERRLREAIVQQQLPALADMIQDQLAGLAAAIKQRPGGEKRQSGDAARERPGAYQLAVAQSQAAFSQAEKLLLRYFENPNTQFVAPLIESLEAAAASIQQIEGLPDQTEAIIATLGQYEQTGLRAIQATRSYLHFRNVVMAGEASEVTYYSNKLRELAGAERTRMQALVAVTSRNVNRITGFTIFFAALAAAFVSGRLALRIVPPITALTHTFSKLSSGETLLDIPGSQRTDEIGRMAQAAAVFSDQNRRTRELLAQAESLGSELQAQAAELEASNQQLDSFAYIASHDLKSPLRGIRQLATWIAEDSEEQLSADSQRHLAQLKARITKLESLLEDLLNFSRVGRLQADPEEVDVGQVMDGIVQITDNPDNVTVRIPPDLPTVKTVRAPLEQVLLNLVGNAIKHNDKDADGLVELLWDQQGDAFRVTVRDNGPGIDEKDHDRVFQMYQRVGDPQVDGSGMGLAIVKKQIENVGGEFRLESKLGQGASFELTWPVETIENPNPA